MATIVIFDDEETSIARLRALVHEHMPQGVSYGILEATSLDELKEILAQGTAVDILLADIMMPEGQPSGIEVVRRLFPPETGTQVIYVSGYLEQAPEVYATSHLYFLLKPIDPAKLADALGRACKALAHRAPTMLRIKTGRKERLINLGTISYIESDLHKVTVHAGGATYESYTKLDELQKQLPSSFVRCHRSFVVNLASVSKLEADEIRLHDGTFVPVSRRRSREVQKALLAYLSARS